MADYQYPSDYVFLSQFVGKTVEVIDVDDEKYVGYAWRLEPPPVSDMDVSVIYLLNRPDGDGGPGYRSDRIKSIRVV